MKRKCPSCSSCLKYKSFNTEMFLYCDLCFGIYKVEPGENIRLANTNDLYYSELIQAESLLRRYSSKVG